MKRILPVSFLLVIFSLFGCATATKPIASGQINTDVLSKLSNNKGKIFLASPVITFENAITEAPLPSLEYGGEKATSLVSTMVASQLKGMGLETINVSDVKPAENLERTNAILDKIAENCLILTSSYKDNSNLIPYLRELQKITGADALCLQTVRVKVGRAATYDPNSGAMSQGTNSSSIKLAFLSLADGSILSMNRAFVRYLPSDEKFKDAVDLLFKQS